MEFNLFSHRAGIIGRRNHPSSRSQRRKVWTTPMGILLLCLLVGENTRLGSHFLPTALAFLITAVPTRSSSIISTTERKNASKLWRQPSKWDLILDEEDDAENDAAGPRQYSPCPPDMMYEPRIVQQCHQTFLAIREAGGKEVTNDVYVRDPVDKEVLWYTGKVARISDISLEECIHRVYPMIERHACHLRPKELYPFRGVGVGGDGASVLEVWTAPGDSELEIAYNRPTLQMQRFVHSKEWQYNKDKKTSNSSHKYPSHVKASMVGFQGEVYQEGEDGFRTWRHDDGFPARPELNPGGESRPPTEDELMQFQNELEQQQEVSSSSSRVDVENSGSDIIDAVITRDVASNASSED